MPGWAEMIGIWNKKTSLQKQMKNIFDITIAY